MSSSSSEDQQQQEEAAYVSSCGFCGNGLLRLWVPNSPDDDRSIALCDECELYWEDIAAVIEDDCAPSSGAYPALGGAWHAASAEEIAKRGLQDFVQGESV